MVRLCEMSAVQLAKGIRNGDFKSIDVVHDVLHQIHNLNGKLNAIVVPLFEEAEKEATRLDGLMESGEIVGPLHGVPITVKESLHVKGTASTWGIEGCEADISNFDDALIDRLRESGAIVIGKTNAMQMLLGCETTNPVFGRTLNPWDTTRTPGGSSGGEGAAVAAFLSPLGIGTDIGGSVRTPAHFCGVHSLKPTPGFIPQNPPPKGIRVSMQAAARMSSPGPIARSVEDLRMVFDVMANRRTSVIGVSGLNVGVWMSDGILTPSPSIRRAMREAMAVLEDSGANTIIYEPPNTVESMKTFYGLMSADGGAGLKQSLGTSRVSRQVQNVLRAQSLSKGSRTLLTKALGLLGQEIVAQVILPNVGSKSENEYQRLLDRQMTDRERLMQDMKQHGIDIMICPVFPTPALPHDASLTQSYEGAYNSLMNYWGMSAGAFSCTRVRAGEESDRTASRDKVIRSALATERGSVGLPVAIQVAAGPGREDLVISVMLRLEEAFRERDDYPPAVAKLRFR